MCLLDITCFFLVFTDMLFLQGSEAIFKVALSLLGSHKPLILQHENLETIVDFIKSTLPNLGLVQMEKTISQVWNKLNMRDMQRNAPVNKFLTEKPEQLLQAENSCSLEDVENFWKQKACKLRLLSSFVWYCNHWLLSLYETFSENYFHFFFTNESCPPSLISQAKIDLEEPHKC